MKKRLLSLLTAGVLLLSLCPGSLAADSSTKLEAVRVLGIMAGDGAGNMNLSANVTRAQFVAALWACAGGVPYDANGPFSDVERDSPGATAIAWAYDLGVVQGTGGACFTPDRPVTREEAAMFLRRYAAHLGRDTFLPGGAAACNDFEDISPWADDSLYWATGTGLIGWSEGGRLDPQGTLTQAQLDAILTRFSQ